MKIFVAPSNRTTDAAAFSTPVRRLQDKAQVFPLEEHDAIRTRLTHSIEVSSVARGLGASAAAKLLKGKLISYEQKTCIETIAATCGLIHDLGNPPFGHAGEAAIGSWFAKRPVGFFSAFLGEGTGSLVDAEKDVAARGYAIGARFPAL